MIEMVNINDQIAKILRKAVDCRDRGDHEMADIHLKGIERLRMIANMGKTHCAYVETVDGGTLE